MCNRFHARWANRGKITIYKVGYPSLVPWYEGILLTQRHQIISLETRDPRLSYGEDPSLYLTWAWFGTGSWHPRQTDRQTDRIAIANTRHAVARKNVGKCFVVPCSQGFLSCLRPFSTQFDLLWICSTTSLQTNRRPATNPQQVEVDTQ